MLRAIFVLLLLAVSGALSAAAQESLPIRPGMSLEEVMGRLKPICLRLQGGVSDPKTVTCYIDNASPPAMITASISKKDRAWYIGWWTPVPGPDPIGTANKMAAPLGFTGERAICDRHNRKMPCWSAPGGTVLYAAGRDERSGLFAFYLHNETIEKADGQ